MPKKKAKKSLKPAKISKQAAPKKERISPVRYLKQVGLELKKVAWPGRQEVIVSTIIVIVVVLILSAITFVLDISFTKLLTSVSSAIGKGKG
ncbi:MAG: preprotein translocase subunit SecE [Actinobacteria bacterium]|nr:MAG: preprotein translocase subunit SecE [Actinomycetota bacterium]